MFNSEPLKELVGINERNLKWVYEYNKRHFFPQVDDKINTKELLCKQNVPFPETICIIDNYIHIEEILNDLKKHSGFVVKPSKGKAGGGILILEKEQGKGWHSPSGKFISEDDLIYHISEILFGVYSFGSTDDRVLIEKTICQHSFFNLIYSHGIADIRIICFKHKPVLAMARIPTSHSDGKANLHQGAIGVGLDLETGTFSQASFRGKNIVKHPDSEKHLKGMCVPQWMEVLEISLKASYAVDLEYIGIDIVIDKKLGPLVLEMNARPGLEIQVVNGKLLGKELKRFL